MNLNDLLNTPISAIRDDTLQHYASEYYDPQKAHEYYEEHKKLKGRKKGSSEESSSNDSSPSSDSATGGKTSSSSGSKKESSFEEEYERYQFKTQQKISALQRRLGRLSKEARLLLADEIYAEIDKIREENMNKKYELKAKYGKGSGSSGGGKGAGRFAETTSAAYKSKWGGS